MGIIKPHSTASNDHPEAIPCEVFGNGEEKLVFLHANGYPPGAYTPLLHALGSAYTVLAMYLRPLWQHAQAERLRHWKVFSQDLLTFIHQQGLENVPAIGHSMGGTLLLRAALWSPQSFSKLILIDPVLLPPQYILLWKLLSFTGLAAKYHPLVKAAMRRRAYFTSEAEMFENYRQKPIFARIPDEGLRAYVHSMAAPSENGGVQLRYLPQWEARVYATGIKNDLDIWRHLPDLRRPLMVLRGEESNTFWAQTARWMQKRRPGIQVQVIEGATHLLPLEKPQEVARLSLEFLASPNHQAIER